MIWFERGLAPAAKLLESDLDRATSVQTFMELLQGVKNVAEQKKIHTYLSEFEFVGSAECSE